MKKEAGMLIGTLIVAVIVLVAIIRIRAANDIVGAAFFDGLSRLF